MCHLQQAFSSNSYTHEMGKTRYIRHISTTIHLSLPNMQGIIFEEIVEFKNKKIFTKYYSRIFFSKLLIFVYSNYLIAQFGIWFTRINNKMRHAILILVHGFFVSHVIKIQHGTVKTFQHML